MMPIREVVFFPGMMTPFVVGRAASIRALQVAIAGDKKMFLVAQRDATVEEPTPGDIFRVGTIGNIVQHLGLPDGNIKVLVEGLERAAVVSVSGEGGFFRATVRTSTVAVASGPQVDALVSRVIALCGQHRQDANMWPDDPGNLVDTAAANLPLSIEEKQELLEIFDPIERLRRVAKSLGQQPVDVPISTAVLARWAESCRTMNRLGTLLHQEIEGQNRSRRTHDLAERARRLARHLADELAVYGASVPPGETGRKT